MYKLIFILTAILFPNLLFASDFITRWDMSKPNPNINTNNTISFSVGTTGVVNYNWETVPAGTSGLGTFSGTIATISGLPTNAIIKLRISNTNFNRININLGADRQRLIDIEQWGNTVWSNMATAFYGCNNLTISAIDIPDLTNVNSMFAMLSRCDILNGPLNINNWNTSNVTDMSYLFARSYNFNQPIGSWNTSNVNNMEGMFYAEPTFNQTIGSWNTTNVISMANMFYQASSFNQPIGSWNTGNVTTMAQMFLSANSFNQSIDTWNFNSIQVIENMILASGLDCGNYSALLYHWATNPLTPNNLYLGGTELYYGQNVQSNRNYLINTKGWSIFIDTLTNSICCFTQNSIQNSSTCDYYVFNGQTLTSSGIYYDTLMNVNGCDSLITLYLTINNVNTSVAQAGANLTSNATGATYQWLSCPSYSPILGETNQSFTATANGDFAVVVNENGCTDTSTCFTVAAIGIQEINKFTSFSVYPNPVSNKLYIQSSTVFADKKKEFYNTFGQLILTTNSIEIDVSSYSKGIYYFKCEQCVVKVVVE
jgi:surface protein